MPQIWESVAFVSAPNRTDWRPNHAEPPCHARPSTREEEPAQAGNRQGSQVKPQMVGELPRTICPLTCGPELKGIGRTEATPSERPGFQWSGALARWRRDDGHTSHTGHVAKDCDPAAGKTRRLQPSITNLAGESEGEATPLTMLEKHGCVDRKFGFY